METLFIYLIKSSGLLALFFISYYILLRKETFFTSNRWFLLTGLITSVVLPFVVYTKVVWVEPVVSTIDWFTIPVSNDVEEKSFEDYLPLLSVLAYGIGILLFLSKFAYDFYSLRTVLKGKSIQRQADYKFIDVKENIAPFSYFNTIVYNSDLYSATELENILEHEKVHSEQNHTVDVLISRLFCIVFWFNPFVWLYKKAILQNLEFIADSEALKKISDKKAYQITLLKITTQEDCVAITNHFYQSLIKKRIVMLNKNQSKKRNSWKYLSILPALVAFMFLFQIEVIAQEKEKEEPTLTNYKMKVALHVTPNSTEKELNDEKNFFKKEYNLEMHFSKIKTNKNNEIIAIKVELKDKEGAIKVNQILGENPIKPFDIYAEKDSQNKVSFGFNSVVNKDLERHLNIVKTNKGANKGNLTIEKNTDFWSINNINKDGSDYLIVINGVKQTDNKIIKIPLEEDILTQITIGPETAIEKYGAEGKNGAVEIVTGLQKESKTKNTSSDATEIIVNGKKVSKSEMKTINPSSIKTVDVNKNGEKSTIKITTKNSSDIAEDTEIIVNGKKMSKKELDELDPNEIESININKSNSKNTNTIRVITKTNKKTSFNTAIPAPPVPPKFPDGPLPVAPKPDMSKLPAPPKRPSNLKDKKAMAEFNKKMEEYGSKIELLMPEMTAYEKKIEEIMAKRKAIYEKDMAKYEEAMKKYSDEIEKNN